MKGGSVTSSGIKDLPEAQKNNAGLTGYLLYALFCLLIPASFIYLHLSMPSDGARLSTGDRWFTSAGAVVSTYDPGITTLEEGDVVIGVAEAEMVHWANSLFKPGVSRPEWKFGETVTYTVIRDDETLDLNIRLGGLPVRSILSQHWGALLFAFVSQIVAGFVLLRRPREPAARALFIWAMSGSHTYAWSFFLQVSDIVGGLGFWLFRIATPGLWLMYWPAGLHLALTFPKKMGIIKRYPWLIKALYPLSFGLFLAQLAWFWPQSENILIWLNYWGAAESIVAAVFLFLSIIMIIVQYRTSRTYSEQIRIRWAVYGAGISGTLGLIFWNIAPLFIDLNFLNANLLGLLMLPFPLSLALSIWRYQLFDIDIIIRKTLLYAALTALLALVYFSAVVFLQEVFRSLTGEESAVAIVISTLAIAALFNPLRSRLQEFIDQRFYRRKYDAARALEGFAASARDETDIDRLTGELVRVVQETIEPTHSSLWLKPVTGSGQLAAKDSEIKEPL
jgi:hypothetical protein